MKLPSEMPVMVLSRCILFPEAMLPLHIFEPRYRRMLHDSLQSHRMFSIGTIRRDSHGMQNSEANGIYDMLGVGLIRAAVLQPDGTTNLILQGICRARVTELLDGKPYQLARVEEVVSQVDDSIAVDALAAKIAELVSLRAKLGNEIPEKTLRFLTSLRDPGTLSDLVSFSLIEDCHEKQAILETLDLRIRLKKVLTLLREEIHRLQIIQALKDGLEGSDLKG